MLVQKSTELNIDLNVKDEEGMTAFHLACNEGNVDIIEMLIDLNQEDQSFQMKYHIDLNAKDEDGRTGFHFACKEGDLKIAKMIIQKSSQFNINLNEKDIFGMTAFHLACKFNRTNIIDR